MPPAEQLDTHHKALTLNLARTIYGSFAEIGAGQEVARWFLRVGGASGTVAKAISAYDKEVSDDLYGAGTRYVSRQRLEAMLDREWDQLQTQLRESRGSTSRFFAFADTVSARNYAGTNECHGWMGVRFLTEPGGEPNDVLLHVNMMDPSNPLQQEALGLLGVNLVYGVYHQRESRDVFLRGLAEDIAPGRIEIDLIDIRGRAFEAWEPRALLVELVRSGLAEAVVFPHDGRAVPPTEVFHRKPVVLAPGTFETVKPIHGRILATTLEVLRAEGTTVPEAPIGLFALTADAPSKGEKPPDVPQLLRRVDALQHLGGAVALSRRRALFETTAFVNRFTNAAVRFAVGLPTLIRVFQDAHYGHLEGRILEGISRLFAQNVRVCAYPMTVSALEERLRTFSADGWELNDTGGWVTADRLRPAPPLSHLYAYLVATGFIVPMQPPDS
jgi:hypothetical protein